MPAHVPAFLLTVALMVLLPGASNATITRQTLIGGRVAGWRTVLGTSGGIVIWSAAAALGLSAVVLANPMVFTLFRLAGGVVLALLGVRTLIAITRPAPTAGPAPGSRTPADGAGAPADGAGAPAAGSGARTATRDVALGMASTLGNPKAGVFAVSLLPQFVTADGPVLITTIGLGVVWAAMSGSWNSACVYALDCIRTHLDRPAVRRALEAVTGLVLVIAGAGVALAG